MNRVVKFNSQEKVVAAIFYGLFFFIGTFQIHAQGRLVGRVIDKSGNPVRAAIVTLKSANSLVASITNANGYYTFFGIQEGDYVLQAQKRDFPNFQTNVKILASLGKQLDISLKPEDNDQDVYQSIRLAEAQKEKQARLALAKAKKAESDEKQQADALALQTKDTAVLASIKKPDTTKIDPTILADLNNSISEEAKLVLAKAEEAVRTAKVLQKPSIVGGTEKIYEKLIYPERARNKKIQGVVLAQLLIDEEGDVTKVDIIRSPSDDLSQEVFRIMNEDIHFIPAQDGDKKVGSSVKIGIQFKLDE